MSELLQRDLSYVADIMLRCRYLVALVGAGMSVESGVPPFRGPGGVWTRLGEPSMRAYDQFLADPKAWWERRVQGTDSVPEFREALERAIPNPGHYALVELEEMGLLKYVITQNIDNLHRAAGSKSVAEIHGNRFKLRCMECSARFPREDIPIITLPPFCPHCGGIVKGDGVMFGEPIPPDVLETCQEQTYLCDGMLLLGTSGVVYPAAALPRIAKERGAILEEINTDDTALTGLCDISLRGATGLLLPLLVQEIKSRI